MNKNTITYLVEFFANNNIVKSEYLTNSVSFRRKQNFLICDLTIADVFQTIKKDVNDLESSQCEILMGMSTIDGETYLGVPSSIKVNLNTFQMRRIKLTYIDEILNGNY
jgi:hypothetical protein